MAHPSFATLTHGAAGQQPKPRVKSKHCPWSNGAPTGNHAHKRPPDGRRGRQRILVQVLTRLVSPRIVAARKRSHRSLRSASSRSSSHDAVVWALSLITWTSIRSRGRSALHPIDDRCCRLQLGEMIRLSVSADDRDQCQVYAPSGVMSPRSSWSTLQS